MAPPSDAGSYRVVVTVSDAGNQYETASASMEFVITQAAQDISYEAAAVTKTAGDEAFINPLTQTMVYGEVSYISSDTSVAAVDASDGKVTIVGAGTATITATVSGNSNYTSASASYTLTVNLPEITGAVTISGDEAYGSTLTADLSDTVPDGVTYQWMRGTQDISGATDAAYTLTADDIGETITVVVSHSGYEGTLSAVSGEVQKAAVTVVISGTVTKVYDGTTAISDSNGLTLTLEGVVEADRENVTVSAESIAYEDANAGTAKGLVVTGLALSGSAADYYQLNSTSLNVASAEGQFVITAAGQDISYSEGSVTRHITDSAFTNKLTETTVVGKITYTSDDTDVATVDADGQVTIVGAGTATITATAAAADNYSEATASYTLTVTDHDYAAVVTEPTCTEQGYTTHTCSLCDDSYIDIYVEAHGHDWDYGVVTIEATCTGNGLRTFTCSICKYSDTEVIPATGHSLTHVEAKDATSKEKGNIEYWYCEACGKYFSDAAGTIEIAADSVLIPASAGGTSTVSADTGDSSRIWLYTAVVLTGLLGMVNVYAYRRKNKR